MNVKLMIHESLNSDLIESKKDYIQTNFHSLMSIIKLLIFKFLINCNLKLLIKLNPSCITDNKKCNIWHTYTERIK